MPGHMYTVADAAALIATGAPLLIAGDADLLPQLPAGNWIGGSIANFMKADGAGESLERVSIHRLPVTVVDITTHLVTADELPTFPSRGTDPGFSVVILPHGGATHLAFAKDAAGYPGLFDRPVIGWVSGRRLSDGPDVPALVMDGRTRTWSSEDAVVLHATLAPGHTARVDMVNPFTQGDGDELTFDKTGVAQRYVDVNGERRSFAQYLKDVQFDGHLPMVTNYFGAMINVAIQGARPDGTVDLYSPVFAGDVYRLAAPVGDYVTAVRGRLAEAHAEPVVAFNCIANYTRSGLEGATLPGIGGPFTFGEIAYVLLTQTLVYLAID